MGDEPDLMIGDSGPWVTMLQELLVTFAAETQTPAPAVSGTFDADTEDALRRFQHWNGQVENGLADRHSWPAILDFAGGAVMNFAVDDVRDDRLRHDSTIELGLIVEGVAVGAAANDLYNEWLEMRRLLAEHVAAYDGGAIYDDMAIDQWRSALVDTGTLRSFVAGAAVTEQKRLIEAEMNAFPALHGRLSRIIAAFDAVQRARIDATVTRAVTNLLLKANEIATALLERSPEAFVDLIPGLPDFDDVAEIGIEVLGNYVIALEIVRAGYASTDEMGNDLTSTLAAIAAARDRIRWIEQRLRAAEALEARGPLQQ